MTCMAREYFKCPRCHKGIVGTHSITRHQANMSKAADDPTLCINIRLQRQAQKAITMGLTPLDVAALDHDSVTDDNAALDDDSVTDNNAALDDVAVTEDNAAHIVMPEPIQTVNFVDITRRCSVTFLSYLWKISTRTLRDRNSPVPSHPVDVSKLQFSWMRYCEKMHELCSPCFWHFFLPMHTLSRTAIDTALKSAKTTFQVGDTSRFPSNTRALYRRMSRIESFWTSVMHTTTVDLSQFNLPVAKSSLNFEFLDPLWAWVAVACKQPAEEMQWVPQVLTCTEHPGHSFYGGGVQYGESFAEAFSQCPPGTYPMCVSLHWDGSHAHGVYATPICIGVANSNSLSSDTQCCIGYMPVVSDMGASFQGQATEINFYITQQCIAAILRVLETGARHGVRCRVPSTQKAGTLEERLLIPRLLSLNLDQPEAQKYFGLRNKVYV